MAMNLENENGSEEKKVPVAVVMVPFPEQGHLNMLLHLSRLISGYGIPIHFVSTTTHGRQAKARLQGWNLPANANLNFHELPMSNCFQNPNSSTDDDYSTQNLAFFRALTNLRQPFQTLAYKLSNTARKIVVIYDTIMTYVVQDIRFLVNAESYCFNGISAFSVYVVNWELEGRPAIASEEAEIGLREVPSIDEGWLGEDHLEEGDKWMGDIPKFQSGDLYNTSRVIEGLYLDLLAKEKKTGVENLWAIGPFNPVIIRPDQQQIRHQQYCLDWLDKQQPGSVVYVVFGTTSTLSDEQVCEIALGLERSKHKFLWVLRDADTKSINFDDDDDEKGREIPLPDGYEERVLGQGMVVRYWAPQLEILGHPSTGAFISHCGWNSCMESISNGVPVGTWPMRYDQPMNAVLITNVLKMGIQVRDWNRRDELLPSTAVEKAVEILMSSNEGEEMRKRAADLKNAVSGDSHNELDSFIRHITRSSS